MAGPLQEFVGKVIEICPKYKAIVQFQLDGRTARALLWYDKLKINGENAPEGGSIDDYVTTDTYVKFLCHNFDDKGVDRCGWYITCAWLQEVTDVDLTSTDRVLSGLYNCTGTVLEVARRQGTLSYTNRLNGQEENVLFLGSKLWLSGKRVSAKAALSSLPGLEEGRPLMFDAVPCDPCDSDGKCCWFATVVWKGRKPVMEYDDSRNTRNKSSASLPQLTEIKLLTSNPHSKFLRTEGQVMKILGPEYGLALAAVNNNRWESVLFHRSQATLFDKSLASADLNDIFQEGDKLRIVAAAAPKKMGVRWVASQIRIYVDPSIAHQYQF